MASSRERSLKSAHKLSDKIRTEDVELKSEIEIDFAALLLSPLVFRGLKNAGFVRPSPIQLEAIPIGRCGADLIVQAKSGTGKTCVFAVVALESIKADSRNVQVLVLAPTREIVVQVYEVVLSLASAMPDFKCEYFIGGTPFGEDKIKIKNCQMAVGTPGRIQQLIQEKVLKTDAVRLLVLDEADKLLEENFQNTINWIYHKLPSSKQMLALSATYPEALARLLAKYMQTPTFVRMNEKNPVLIGVKQFYKITEFHPLQAKSFENKIPHVLDVLSSLSFGQCIIFSNYQLRAQGLCDRLNGCGWPATYVSGKKEQEERLRAISSLRQFKCRVLVSTDLTARGIDIENVNLVMNLDVPWDLETYLHRMGRAGRFGSRGIAITFASDGEEEKRLRLLTTNGNLRVARLPGKLLPGLWETAFLADAGSEENGIVEAKDEIPPSEELSRKTAPEPGFDCRSCSTGGHSAEDAPAPLTAGRIEVLKRDLNSKLETLGISRKRDRGVRASDNEVNLARSGHPKAEPEKVETAIGYGNVEEDETSLREFLAASREACSVCRGKSQEPGPDVEKFHEPSTDDGMREIVLRWHEALVDEVGGDENGFLLEMLSRIFDGPSGSPRPDPDVPESDEASESSATEPRALQPPRKIESTSEETETEEIGAEAAREEGTSEDFREEAASFRLPARRCGGEERLHRLRAAKYSIWFSEYVRQMCGYRKRMSS